MKILHIITSFGEGGAQAILSNYCKLGKEKHQLFLISLSSDDVYSKKFKSLGINTFILPLSLNFKSFINLLKLFFIILKFNPDIIQSWLYHADLIASLYGFFLNKKVIWSIHNSDLPSSSLSISLKIIIKLNAFLSYFSPEIIICCANSAKNYHNRLKYCKRKLKVIFNGYPFDYFKPSENTRQIIRKKLDIGNDEIFFGMIARYHPVKGHKIFLNAISKALSKNSKIKVIMIGSNVDENNKELSDLIKKLELSKIIKLNGSVSNIACYLQALDFCVLPSYSEGFPNVIVESMACGVPTIASDVGDVRTIIDGNGWLVEPGNIKSLSEAIEECSFIPIDERTKIGLKCYETVNDRFSLRKMYLEYEKIYQMFND